MTTVAILLRENDCAFVLEDAGGRHTGTFPEQEIDLFLKERAPDAVHLILAKPRVFWRQVSFPFSRRSDISLALPAELEDLLPGPPDSFLYAWQVCERDKEATTVSVTAWERSSADRWAGLARQHRFNLLVTVDWLVLCRAAQPYIPERDYLLVYSDDAYGLVVAVRNGSVAGVYSSWGTQAAENLLSMLGTSHPSRAYRVGAAAPGTASAAAAPVPGMPAADSPPFFLPAAKLSRQMRRDCVRLRPIGVARRPLGRIAGVAAASLLAIAAACAPYFQIRQQRRAVDELDRKMRDIFRQACPEVTVVKDPLSQMQERLRTARGKPVGLPAKVSVLDTMADFVRAVPENLPIEINEYILTEGLLSVSGKTDNIKSLERLRVALEKSGRFAGVRVGDLSFDAEKMVLFNMLVKMTDR